MYLPSYISKFLTKISLCLSKVWKEGPFKIFSSCRKDFYSFFFFFFELKIELNMFLNYYMELDNSEGKMAVIQRLFCEKKSFLVHLRSAKPRFQTKLLIYFIMRGPLENASYYKGCVILEHFNFPFKRFV